MKQKNTSSIILRRINYGEADRILTVLTKDEGKVSMIAKGARKSKSKLAGGLELFSVSNISFIEGKSELKTIISTRLESNYSRIVDNIDITMIAYDFLKYIDSATKEDCESEYFELLDNALSALNDRAISLDIIKVWFALKLLDLKGVAINLHQLVSGKKFSEDQKYKFDYDDMGFFLHDSGDFEPKHIKFLRLVSKVNRPENILKVEQADELAVDLKPTLEQCLKIS